MPISEATLSQSPHAVISKFPGWSSTPQPALLSRQCWPGEKQEHLHRLTGRRVSWAAWFTVSCSSMEQMRQELAVFNHCKLTKTDHKATSGILLRVRSTMMKIHFLIQTLQELEQMGILRTDPRLEPCIQVLKMIKKKTFGAVCGIENKKLDFNQFHK